jgi:DNA-binding PadR family transcriptional regulator
VEIPKDLVAASASPLVLSILAEGPSYGYAIIKRVGELSGGELEWTEGLLYPLLHRLERQEHIRGEWGESETGRRRKYYHLTEEGRRALADHKHQWRAVSAALESTWTEMRSALAPTPRGAFA